MLDLYYIVDADDLSLDLNFDTSMAPVLSSGATIKDAAGNSLQLSTLPAAMYLSNTKNIKLVGTPATLTITDIDIIAPFSFGTRYVGSSFNKKFRIENSAAAVVPAQFGTSVFDLTQFNYSSGWFPGASGNCGAQVPPGSSCEIEVEFGPNNPLTYTGNLTINYDNGVVGAASLQKSLTGAAIYPWIATSASILTGRTGHSIVRTDDRILIWGGSSGSTFYNTGAIFDPTSNTWTPMSTTGAPTGRAQHRAVWTGSKMLIWGGSNMGTQYLVSGAAYDPVNNSWSTISVTGAPSGRKDFSAIWTGSKMIIWGGYVDLVGADNSGGSYDPDLNAWTSVSTLGAPAGRHSHAAIWTGTHMIVWGGMAPSYSNEGGVYNPVTDTWTPTGTTGAPSPRAKPGVVWTGDKMIIWGGMDSTSKLGDGAVLDPTAAIATQWSPLPTSGAPAPRVNHSMVWTGTRLIVWGGFDSVYMNDGGIFNPLLSSWVPSNNTGAPAPRAMNAGVWMNGRMFIWGGTGAGELNTGGMFAPLLD
jgi:hypothetical protein